MLCMGFKTLMCSCLLDVDQAVVQKEEEEESMDEVLYMPTNHELLVSDSAHKRCLSVKDCAVTNGSTLDSVCVCIKRCRLSGG